MDREQIQKMLTDCEEAQTTRNNPFSEWEHEFLESVFEQFHNKKFLTIAQASKLEQIWEKI